ncbi:MAG: hypothetical protein ACOCWQ_02460 [Nanoarchaeota archaeon]
MQDLSLILVGAHYTHDPSGRILPALLDIENAVSHELEGNVGVHHLDTEPRKLNDYFLNAYLTPQLPAMLPGNFHRPDLHCDSTYQSARIDELQAPVTILAGTNVDGSITHVLRQLVHSRSRSGDVIYMPTNAILDVRTQYLESPRRTRADKLTQTPEARGRFSRRLHYHISHKDNPQQTPEEPDIPFTIDVINPYYAREADVTAPLTDRTRIVVAPYLRDSHAL